MKKILSLTLSLSMALSASTFTAFAKDTPVAVEVDETVYAQLMKNKWICDSNSDGIITEAELNETTYLNIDLDGINDLSWVSKLSSCRYISFKNGTLTDFSALKQMPALRSLSMDNVPLTDISFMKELDLESCDLKNMEQITVAQRIDVLKWSAPDIWAGTSGEITCAPQNLVDYSITLDNSDIAVFLNGTNTTVNPYEHIYGLSAGTTAYTVSLEGQDYYTGELKIKETPGAYDPQLHNTAITNFEVGYSNYYNPDSETGNSGQLSLVNGTLYSICGCEVKVVETDVADYEYVYKRNYGGSYNYADMVLKTDGTLLLNGESIMNTPVRAMYEGYILAENGDIYTIVPKGDGFITAIIASDSKEWVEDCSPLYITKTGHLKYYSCKLNGDGRVSVFTGNTNIGTPVSAYKAGSTCYVVDGAHTLYKLDFDGTFTKTKLADNAVSVGISEDYGRIEYVTTEGTTELIRSTGIGVSDYLSIAGKNLGIKAGTFYIHQYQERGIEESNAVFSYYINSARTMSLSFLGNYCGLTNVESEICSAYDTAQEHGYVYFLRTDGSIWQYNLDTQQWQETIAGTAPIVVPEKIKGDVNADGFFNVSDVVLLQKWLLAVPNTELKDWKAADLCDDNALNVFDLCIMKRELMNSMMVNE